MRNYNNSYNYNNDIILSALYAVKDYITISDFAIECGFSPESIMKYRRDKLTPSHVFIKAKGQATRVDRNWFNRRWTFQAEVKMFNQEVYYLLEKDFSVLEMARTISAVSQATVQELASYIQYILFVRHDGNLGVGLLPAAYAVYRYGHRIERRLKHNGTSIERILDIRAGLC